MLQFYTGKRYTEGVTDNAPMRIKIKDIYAEIDTVTDYQEKKKRKKKFSFPTHFNQVNAVRLRLQRGVKFPVNFIWGTLELFQV